MSASAHPRTFHSHPKSTVSIAARQPCLGRSAGGRAAPGCAAAWRRCARRAPGGAAHALAPGRAAATPEVSMARLPLPAAGVRAGAGRSGRGPAGWPRAAIQPAVCRGALAARCSWCYDQLLSAARPGGRSLYFAVFAYCSLSEAASSQQISASRRPVTQLCAGAGRRAQVKARRRLARALALGAAAVAVDERKAQRSTRRRARLRAAPPPAKPTPERAPRPTAKLPRRPGRSDPLPRGAPFTRPQAQTVQGRSVLFV